MNKGLSILVVDDDRRMTRTLADILTMSGHTVMEASSGPDALEKVRTMNFDCVLTDIKMPEMDGVELHRRLREIQPGLPVLLMTAYAAEELIRQGLTEGAAGVFDKPLDINYLLGFFNSLVKNRTIVIVDDDPAFCQTLDDILAHRGFKVLQVKDPLALDSEITTNGAQTILLDLKLNGFSGLDVLKKIRVQHPNLPVIIVTAHRQEMSDSIRAAFEINAYACLYKPLEIPKLLELLAKVQLENLRVLLKKPF
jgi:two-component system response regulator HydG